MDEMRAPLLAVATGLALALAGVLLAGATGGPYLEADSINGWIVVFAVGLLAAMFATPFSIERRMRSRFAESDRRWERALLAWGGISLLVLVAGLMLGVAGGWSGSSLAGTVGLLVTIEAAIVLGAMVVWLLSS